MQILQDIEQQTIVDSLDRSQLLPGVLHTCLVALRRLLPPPETVFPFTVVLAVVCLRDELVRIWVGYGTY